MRDELDFIYSRRSVRQYTGHTVSDEMIQELMEAAMAAPSAVAKDPWRFIIVRQKDLLQKVTDGLPYGKMLPQAGCGLVVCGDIRAANGGEVSYLLQDCSAAIMNILLAANRLGLGTVWLGVHPNQERMDYLTNLFSLPKEIIPVSAIALGTPAETPPARTRFNSTYVHYNSW